MGPDEISATTHLDILGLPDGDTLEHGNVADNLLAEEVTDLNRVGLVVDDDVDGEMGVDETHLVSETVLNTLDHVLDLGSDRAQASNVLAASVPDNQADLLDLVGRVGCRCDRTNRHGNVLGRLLEGAARSGNGDDTGLDSDGDALTAQTKQQGSVVRRKRLRSGHARDGELLFLVDLLHLLRAKCRVSMTAIDVGLICDALSCVEIGVEAM